MPEHMPEDMPGRMPEDMPEDMPDRMPEGMSDRMPEDLPVTKRINVMVGMTRSKVIYVFIYPSQMISTYNHPSAASDCDAIGEELGTDAPRVCASTGSKLLSLPVACSGPASFFQAIFVVVEGSVVSFALGFDLGSSP